MDIFFVPSDFIKVVENLILQMKCHRKKADTSCRRDNRATEATVLVTVLTYVEFLCSLYGNCSYSGQTSKDPEV